MALLPIAIAMTLLSITIPTARRNI
jgi:hypothetical protein